MSLTTTTTPATSKYLQGPYLSSGAQATLLLSRRISDAQLVVEKIFKPSPRGAKFGGTPLDILDHLRRAPADATRRIVGILEMPTVESPRLVLEYCYGGDLARLIKVYRAKNLRISEAFIWHVFEGLSEAVCFLHTGGRLPGRTRRPITSENSLDISTSTDTEDATWTPIMHRDIKPANVLLTINPDDPTGLPLVKLADLDLAAFYDPNSHEYFGGGTHTWQPAEQWLDAENPRATPAGDVWAVGAIVHALATGQPPLPEGEERRVKLDDASNETLLRLLCEEEEEKSFAEKAAKRALPKVVERIWGRYGGEMDLTMRRALEPVWERRADAVELVRVVGRNSRVWVQNKGCQGRKMRQPWNYDALVGDWQFVRMTHGGEWGAAFPVSEEETGSWGESW